MLFFNDQYMYIATWDHNLGFLGKVLWEPDFDPLNNRNPFVKPTDPNPAPINAIVTAAQITEFIPLYKDYREKLTTYCAFCIILITIITNKCTEKYTTTLKHRIYKFCQFEPLTLFADLYTDYIIITSFKLIANLNHMNACWNPPTPIADPFNHSMAETTSQKKAIK